MSNLTLSQNGIAFIANNEAPGGEPALTAYQDQGGVWTIGFGHTAGVKAGDTCTAEQAFKWLSDDAQFAVQGVDTLVHTALNQNQFDALVDFTFNLGIGNLKISTLLFLLNRGDYDEAADQFPRWDEVGGVPNPGVLSRRERDRQLFLTPVQAA